MKTDAPLRVLLRKYARDLLGLLGDAGASLVAVENVEIQQMERRVDGLPPAPRADPVFRVALGGREVNRWRFDVVRLWELDATVALRHGSPGFLALLPLMRGGADLGLLERAARRIEEAFPGDPLPEAEAVLIHLAGRHYTFVEVSRIVGREKMIQSSVSQHFWNEGLKEGREKGRLEDAREVCLRMVREYHPVLLTPATAQIEGCADPARLAEWIVSAPRLTDDEFARLLSIE